MASQTGQDTEHMSPGKEAGHSSLLDDLHATPGAFAFPQAIDIAERWLRSQGGLASADSFRFSVNPDLSFPPGDITSLDVADRGAAEMQVSVMLNLMGLHGAGSPLPAYFTEHVAQHADDADALRDFFDIFNHQLVSLLHGTWTKYRYYAQYKVRAADRLSDRFFGFIGVGHKALRDAKNLHWPRLMAYMGLIAFNGESAGSLESILRHYFAHENISIIPCIRRWVSVPQEQLTRLGESNCALGNDFILGESIPDQTGKFRIRVAGLTWARFKTFLPTEANFAALQTLVKFILKSRLDFDVELRLLPGETPDWRLDEESDCRLGWSSWSGDGGDGIVVLESNHQEI